MWQAIVSETFVSLDCHASTKSLQRGSILTAGSSSTTLSVVEANAQTVNRTPERIRRDNAEIGLISFQLEGNCVVSQAEQDIDIKPGQFTIYDSTRPYSLEFDRPFRQLVMQVSRNQLSGSLGPLKQLCAQNFHTHSAAHEVAGVYLQSLASRLGNIDERNLDQYGSVALDLLVLAISPHEVSSKLVRHRSSAVLREQANGVIASRFKDEAVSTPDIASELNVSARRLQEVFAQIDSSPMQALWDYRLKQVRKQLENPLFRSVLVTDIALRNGFCDSAQLSRKFKQAFGVSPRQFRENSSLS